MQLKLAVSALIKLANSNVLTSLISGCWGLARLCDGREEMIVEDGDLKCLIRRLVYVMKQVNYSPRETFWILIDHVF